MDYIQPTGEGEFPDVRQKTLHDLVVWYDNSHNPERLKAQMDELLSGRGEVQQKISRLIAGSAY